MAHFDKGRCCQGENCKHPDGELRHNCPICLEVVHLLCGVVGPDDKIVCNSCHNLNTNNNADNESTVDAVATDQIMMTPENAQDMTNVEVNISPSNEEFTTITDSVKSSINKMIPKDYFILKNQQINKK